MKYKLTVPLLLLLTVVFSGCPVGIEYPLGEQGKEKINETLIGTWVNEKAEVEVKSMKIERLDDYSYRITVLEKGSLYSITGDTFKAWSTTINDKTFMCLENSSDGKYYHYHFTPEGKNKLITHDIALLDGGIDAVKSTELFRQQVISSMQKPEFLSSEMAYTRK